MLNDSLLEMSALNFVLNYISLKDLITAAYKGFDCNGTTLSLEKADVCLKALETFLR